MSNVDVLLNKAIKFNVVITHFSNGNNILRDKNLLDSAIGSCFQSMFGEDLYKTNEEKAYMMFLNIARNHPFIDGNKRTAALMSDYFLMENGLELSLESDDKFKLMVNLIEKNIDIQTGLFVFKSLVKPIESINRNHLNEELKKDFLKQFNNVTIFLESTNNEQDVKDMVLNNFMKNFSSQHHVNFVDLLDVYENEIKQKNIIEIENDR